MVETSAVSIYRRLLTKPMYYFTLLFITSFFLVSFDERFGTLFMAFIVISGFAYLFSISKIPGAPLLKIGINTVSGNSGKAFVQGLLALVVFLLVAMGVVQLLQPIGFTGLQSVIDRIAQTSLGATPILQGNPWAILFVGGILIPIVETELFFITLPQVLSSIFHIPLVLSSPQTWILMSFIAGIFTFYHIEAKAITDNVAWLLTFIFGLFQGWLVLKFREGESAIFMHVQNNFIGIAQRLFLKPFGI